MNWFVAKIVFQIISGEGSHLAQFDEQLRLINADDEKQAYEKAKSIGLQNEESFLNDQKQNVKWKFIDVAELNALDAIADGTELYYQIHETENAELYIKWAHHKGSLINMTTAAGY